MKKLILFAIAMIMLMFCLPYKNLRKQKEEIRIADSLYKDSLRKDSLYKDSLYYDSTEARYKMDSALLVEECGEYTIELIKSDSETYKRGYYFTMGGDSLTMTPYSERKGVVKQECEDAEKQGYTRKELRKQKESLLHRTNYLVRNADRTLDTIVNYQHIIFTILP